MFLLHTALRLAALCRVAVEPHAPFFPRAPSQSLFSAALDSPPAAVKSQIPFPAQLQARCRSSLGSALTTFPPPPYRMILSRLFCQHQPDRSTPTANSAVADGGNSRAQQVELAFICHSQYLHNDSRSRSAFPSRLYAPATALSPAEQGSF